MKPTTEAGRTYIQRLGYREVWHAVDGRRDEAVRDILAIEQEAVAEYRKALVARVRALPRYTSMSGAVTTTPTTSLRIEDFRAAVIALIEQHRPKGGPG